MPLDGLLPYPPDISGIEPLDLTGMFPGQPPTGATAPPAKGPSKWKEFGPLAALLPIVLARGGRTGAAALLQGMQQARLRKQQEAQQQAQTDRVTRNDEYARQNTLADNDTARRQQAIGYLKDFDAKLAELEDPTQVEALTNYYAQFGATLGRSEE